MKRLLIATIMRNAMPHLHDWTSQLCQLIPILTKEGWEVELTCFENDSVDGTDRNLHDMARHTGINTRWITTVKLGTTQYPSVWNADRLRNLAVARQTCLDQAGPLDRFDKVAYIDVDYTWDPAWCAELVLAHHPAAAGIEPDIYSGWSLRSLSHPKESIYLYDTCATRATDRDTSWDIGEDCGRWRGRSLVPTPGMTGVHANCLHRVWSTFNGFCVYNARPFAEGVKWTYWNTRLDPDSGQVVALPNGGIAPLEADTVAICETFRARGYDKVFLNTNCLTRHT